MCSSTSAAMTTSKLPSGNGIRVASPSAQVAWPSAGTSPASSMAATIALTDFSSARSVSRATTCAPRRSDSNACRPAPQPRSSTRVPGPTGRRPKSTVSTVVLAGLLLMSRVLAGHVLAGHVLAGHVLAGLLAGDGQAVLGDGGPGHGGPGEPLLHPAQRGRRQPLPLGGRV